jgi:enoyl-CoA hydratase
MSELVNALEEFEKDDAVSAIILTGGEEFFTTGIDLKELSQTSHNNLILSRRLGLWNRLRKISKPIIGAVSGYCLGGGNELIMNCDIVIASETASFGQPEVNIGLIPGAGGTQRLTKFVGKFWAMEMILTGKSISAQEACKLGLVTRIFPVKDLLPEAKKIANEIASKPPMAVRVAKETILKAEDTDMQVGLDFERKMFNTLFTTYDAKEGIRAFLEKRKPVFKGR